MGTPWATKTNHVWSRFRETPMHRGLEKTCTRLYMTNLSWHTFTDFRIQKDPPAQRPTFLYDDFFGIVHQGRQLIPSPELPGYELQIAFQATQTLWCLRTLLFMYICYMYIHIHTYIYIYEHMHSKNLFYTYTYTIYNIRMLWCTFSHLSTVVKMLYTPFHGHANRKMSFWMCLFHSVPIISRQ